MLQFFCSLLLIFSSCFGQTKPTLSQEEWVVLREFFQVLFEESEAGYVLFNKKPVCIHGFFSTDPFIANSSAHKHSVALREGARIWNRLGEKNVDVLIHIAEKEDPLIPGWVHVLVINRPLFIHIVSEHLPLFQYVLGPSVTPENLLNSLLSKDQTYYSLLKEDKVLIGEILGFGIQNSLYGSRSENIQESTEKDTPPFMASSALVREHAFEYIPFQPGFGFTTINEEAHALQEKMTISSEKLVEGNPAFIFGCLKDSQETKILIAELESAQEQIEKLLQSPTYLELILKKITGKEFAPTVTSDFYFQFDREEINEIIARGIWESIQEYDFDYLPFFIEGLGKTEIPHFKTDRMAWFPAYRRELIQAKENLRKANDFFQSLEHDKDYQCIVPQKLYYKIQQNGRGDALSSRSLVSLEYSIFSPLGHYMNHQSKVTVNLKNTIPGFAHGIRGMRIGETREIYIHPSLAYGFDTYLDKCMHLKALVTLLDVHESNSALPALISQDLALHLDPKMQISRDENYKMALIEKGAALANHLGKCEGIDLTLIQNYLKLFHSTQTNFTPTTQEEQSLINQVHWNIYFGSAK